MKLVDTVLFSVALGLGLIAVHLYTSEYPADVLALQNPTPPPFDRIVLHQCALHGTSWRGVLHAADPARMPFHFIIEAEDSTSEELAHATVGWKDLRPLPHVMDPDARARSISIGIGGDPRKAPARRQIAALSRLLKGLCERFGIRRERILLHRQVDPGSGCPLEPGSAPAPVVRAPSDRRP
jgi:hypothetical protein